MVLYNSPRHRPMGKLDASTSVYSINTVCRMIEADKHCWYAMMSLGAYVITHKRQYNLVHLRFMLEMLQDAREAFDTVGGPAVINDRGPLGLFNRK